LQGQNIGSQGLSGQTGLSGQSGQTGLSGQTGSSDKPGQFSSSSQQQQSSKDRPIVQWSRIKKKITTWSIYAMLCLTLIF